MLDWAERDKHPSLFGLFISGDGKMFDDIYTSCHKIPSTRLSKSIKLIIFFNVQNVDGFRKNYQTYGHKKFYNTGCSTFLIIFKTNYLKSPHIFLTFFANSRHLTCLILDEMKGKKKLK